jgi:hypothetical protein
VDDAVVGTAIRLRGEQTVDGAVSRIESDAVHVDDARLGEVVLRPRHKWLRRKDGTPDGTPISTWTICNVLVAGNILTIASDLHALPDGSVEGTTSI